MGKDPDRSRKESYSEHDLSEGITEQDLDGSEPDVRTEGGAFVQRDVHIQEGDFVGRDQYKTVFTEETAYNVAGLANPYLGLSAFTYSHRAAFGGREAVTRAAVDKITKPGSQQTLLFITGASGSGKSSFAQAGLLPALEGFYHERNKGVARAVFRPSSNPLAMLSDALALLSLPELSFQELERSTPEEFACFLVVETPSNQVNLILIDQFEELFTQSAAEQREVLSSFLTALPEFGDAHTHVLATLRSDFLRELFEHPKLWEFAKQGVELRAMSPEELKTAIQKPLWAAQTDAAYQGKRFDPALLDQLAEDTSKEAAFLPLLQTTLQELWNKGALTLGNYLGLDYAIRRRAETVLQFEDYNASNPEKARSPEDQRAIMGIFLDLVEVSLDDDPERDVRRRWDKSTLVSQDPRRKRLVNELILARLLSAGQEVSAEDEVETVDIIHESLILNWDRLRDAIADGRQILRRRAYFEQQRKEWIANGRSDPFLLAGVRLAEARELEGKGDIALSEPDARAFLQRSNEQAEAAQRRRIRNILYVVVGLSVALLIALVATGAAIRQRDLAETQAEISLAGELAAHSRDDLERFPQRSLLLAIEALNATRRAGKSSLPAVEQALHDNLYSTGGIGLADHEGPVELLAFSPDGHWLATGSEDATVRLWDLSETDSYASPIILRGHNQGITALSFSPNGHWLATGGEDATVRLWDLSSDNPTANPIILKGHENRISRIAFSPDGRWLATGDVGNTFIKNYVVTARLWDLSSPHPSANPIVLIPEKGLGIDFEFSPDSHWLATRGIIFANYNYSAAAQDYAATARVWDLSATNPSAKPLLLRGHEDGISALAFSPDGYWLATGGEDAAIRLWNISTDNPAENPIVLQGHKNRISQILFSPDGRWLATGGEQNESVYLWDVSAENPSSNPAVLTVGNSSSFALAFSPDGHWLATINFGDIVRLWDLSSPDPSANPFVLPGIVRLISAYDFSPDGRWLATGSWDQTTRLWDLSAKDPTADPFVLRGHDDRITALDFSPDGRWLATGSKDKTARLWDLNASYSGAQPLVLSVSENCGVFTCDLSPDGRWLAEYMSGEETSIRVWDLSTLDLSTHAIILRGHEALNSNLAFSTDGRWLAAGGENATVTLWDLFAPDPSTNSLILRGHEAWDSKPAFSPDGRWLATYEATYSYSRFEDYGHIIWLWDLSAPDPSANPIVLQGHEAWVNNLAFSPDGRWLATGSEDSTVLLWDLSGKNPASDSFEMKGHQSEASGLEFSPDGRWFATFDYFDSVVQLWDLNSFNLSNPTFILQGDDHNIFSFIFSPDGHWLATGNRSSNGWLWDLFATDPSTNPLVLGGHDGTDVDISPDGKWLATKGNFFPDSGIDNDDFVQMWDLSAPDPSANPIVLRGQEGAITALAFSPDGHWLATGSWDKSVRLWDLSSKIDVANPLVLNGYKSPIHVIYFSLKWHWLIAIAELGKISLTSLDVDYLADLACRTAGRNLSQDEWQQYLGDRPYGKTCPNLPAGE